MQYMKICRYILVMLVVFSSVAVAQTTQPSGQLHFIFVNPSSEQDDFWNIFTAFTQAAADDLDVELEVLYSNRNTVTMLEHLRSVAERRDKPDAILLKVLKGMGKEALEIANVANIPIFLVNAGVDYAEVGEPRENYAFWIGDKLPKDEQMGYDLAVFLIETALQAGMVAEDGKVHILGFNGTATDAGAIRRANGLTKAVADYPEDVILHQITSANWSGQRAAEKFYWLYQRYPDTQVIWSASDGMALGVAQAAQEQGIALGFNSMQDDLSHRLLIGGAAWVPEVFEPIRDGEILVSMGGELWEGGWSMVLLHDYFYGYDFETTMMRTTLLPLTAFNIDDYLEYFSDSDWSRIDFTTFSKAYYPEIKHYDFSLPAVLAHLKQQQ